LARIKVIKAEREAQKAMIEQKNTIELGALRKQREAEAQARALKEISAAEALAAFDGVAQRVEMTRLTLDAQVCIEIAKAQALGAAMAAMNIKLIGDPAAAASLLRMVTLADGLGEVVKATPDPVLAVGQQLLNKLTADPKGASLLKLNGTNGHDH
jgi:hypothetical protein